MSSQDPSEAPGSDDLQFENAEYLDPAGALTCVACKGAVGGTYYEVNGRVLCPRCRDAVEAHARGGSGAGRFARATLLGSLAAIAGFLVYFGVMMIANMEIGLISVLVGFMVGTGVRNGSRHRGGWPYQSLAVFLTYLAIVASYSAPYIPAFLEAWRESQGKSPDAVKEAETPPDEAKPGAGRQAPGNRAAPVALDVAKPSLASFLAMTLPVIVPFCFFLPISEGLQEPIGLLIVGFALWEAWKLNRRVPIVFNGPFEAGRGATSGDGPPASPPPGEVASHA